MVIKRSLHKILTGPSLQVSPYLSSSTNPQ